MERWFVLAWLAALLCPLRAAHAADRRPILTGCAKACAKSKDQACNTQCHVCVESHACHKLDDECPICLKETQSLVHKLVQRQNVDDAKFVTDSGGDALIHDSIQMSLHGAKLDVMDSRRSLREARNGVLQAQQEAEWAVEERQEDIADLKTEKASLRVTQEKVDAWKQRNQEKLEKLRMTQELERGKQVRLENKLAEAKEALETFETRQATDDGKNQSTAEDNEWKLRREVERHSLAADRGKAKLKNLLSDSRWVDRGLQREVKEANQRVDTAKEELRQARAMEKMTRHRLEGAKDIYRDGAKSSQVLGQKTARLEAELDDHPLPTDLPVGFSDEARSARCSPYCSGSSNSRQWSWLAIIVAVAFAPSL